MLKMYSTQLQRVFEDIRSQEEKVMEGARVLAQALVGEGKIYVTASERFEALAQALVKNRDTPRGVSPLAFSDLSAVITRTDRLLVLTNGEEHEQEIAVLQKLHTREIPYVFVGPGHPEIVEAEMMELPLFLQTAGRALVPDLDGSRSGSPEELAVVYAYQALMFELGEMTAETLR